MAACDIREDTEPQRDEQIYPDLFKKSNGDLRTKFRVPEFPSSTQKLKTLSVYTCVRQRKVIKANVKIKSKADSQVSEMHLPVVISVLTFNFQA